MKEIRDLLYKLRCNSQIGIMNWKAVEYFCYLIETKQLELPLQLMINEVIVKASYKVTLEWKALNFKLEFFEDCVYAENNQGLWSYGVGYSKENFKKLLEQVKDHLN